MLFTTSTRPPGRPRCFNEPAVLDRAIDLFSRRGYAGVTISDLTAATGLTVGSLYKAYKDKEGIFLKALDRYVMLREANIDGIAGGSRTARARIAALLELYAGLSQGMPGLHGCMVVAGIADIDQDARPAQILQAIILRRRATLVSLLQEGRADKSLDMDIAPEASADVLLALLQGMRVIGKVGAFPVDTRAFVERAMRVIA